MTDTPKKLVVDIETGISQYIDLTPEEVAQREADAQAFLEATEAAEADAQAKAELKESARAKLIAGESLTAEEAAVITL
ncbi:hypothetical protein UFOVP655_84 [uncultured Caudovirales phage]|uniref:Uncharacterized protein n=1 Tax=uncultured Caudovirales phage TaxID=2100421 RepID=A0A6J5NMU7_9CAUD|nr:hypothetical protein UFOVP655_84 [uncultured Caudovirales phage]